MRGVEEPVTVEEAGYDNDRRTVTTHPAFGQISASRVSGRMNLYGSDFAHNGFISIRVSTSQLNRDLSHDWHFAGEQILELSLSEAQWATFVSSLNCGSGVPCTLEHRGGAWWVPMLPDPKPRSAQFSKEARECTKRAVETLEELANALDGMGLPKGKTNAIKESLQRAASALTSSVPFVLQSFDKHVEKTVENAKTEIHGYMTSAIQRAGMTALMDASEASPPLALPADGSSYCDR